MAITEQIELLGKGLYNDIPDILTLKQLPTSSELEYVGSEDFDKVMLEKILPTAIEEDINFEELLEIDYQWILRCLRILNYGPYHTTNSIFCKECGNVSQGEYRVNLNTINVKPLPEGFVNDIVISKDEFLDFDKDIHLKLPTIRKILNSEKDKAFNLADGGRDVQLARICYMISQIGNKKELTPVEIKLMIQNNFSAADYKILGGVVRELTDYGLRAGGSVVCPNCGYQEAAFIALVNDKFFRPTLGDLREWKHARGSRKDQDVPGDKAKSV